MNIANHQNPYRWVLLRHTGAPNDSRGIHFDLLLEDREFCRTWRLSQIPILDGAYVEAIYSNPHKLHWLDIKKKVVSRNRGVATRIKKGTFLNPLPSVENFYINLSLEWEDNEVVLVIDEKGCKIFTKTN